MKLLITSVVCYDRSTREDAFLRTGNSCFLHRAAFIYDIFPAGSVNPERDVWQCIYHAGGNSVPVCYSSCI